MTTVRVMHVTNLSPESDKSPTCRYVKRAKLQGHPAAIERMKNLRGCYLCGAPAAPLACELCLQAKYCDETCSAKHWNRGGGVAECEGDAPHKRTCPRAHYR
jgi:hypothetical protein